MSLSQVDFAVGTAVRDAETIVVSVHGEVDVVTAPDLEGELLKAVDVGATLIVVDLTETTFFDSSAIHVLIRGSRRLQASDAHVCVVCSTPSIKRVLEITRVDRLLEIHDTVEQAAGTSRRAALEPPGLLTRLSEQFGSRTAGTRLPA